MVEKTVLEKDYNILTVTAPTEVSWFLLQYNEMFHFCLTFSFFHIMFSKLVFI
jgi:hypothetical protein